MNNAIVPNANIIPILYCIKMHKACVFDKKTNYC